MAWYYVKVNGTAAAGTDNGRATTQRTGLWNTDVSTYYNTLTDCYGALTPPIDGDVICVSDAHYVSYSVGNLLWNSGGSFSGVGLLIVSVDNSNQEKYKPGAEEHSTSNSEHLPNKNVKFAGLKHEGQDESIIISGIGSSFSAQDCTFVLGGGAGDHFLHMVVDGQWCRLLNVDIITSSALENLFILASGNHIYWDGGSIIGTSPDYFFSALGYNGGANFFMTGVDMKDFTGDLFPSLVAGQGDAILIRFTRCLINSALPMPTPGTDLKSTMHRIEFLSCDDDTSNTLHKSWIGDGCGLAKTIDTVYNSGNMAWDEGADKSSWKVETTPLCSPANPFTFNLAEEYIDLADTASDKITVNLVTDAVLTDADIAAFLCYPDGTNIALPRWTSSDVFAAKTSNDLGTTPMVNEGATLATSALGASDWVGEPASPNFYKLELDTVDLAGEGGSVLVRIEIYKDIGTDVLYIDSELEIGT